MGRLKPEEKYKYNLRKQQKILEDFVDDGIERAQDLMLWYKRNKTVMPVDEYRACTFFINNEYRRKAGSLTLLYKMYLRCLEELPEVTKENAFDILRFRYKMYAKVLKTGGFNGATDW